MWCNCYAVCIVKEENTVAMNFTRLCKIELPKGQSAFLWGPRKTGKSTLLKMKFPDSLYYDLLRSEYYLTYLKQPYKFRAHVLGSPLNQLQLPIIVDEVQKVPQLLDEIHLLIEDHDCQFILCGSSARKLKRGHANLLGGRAWQIEMFPLTSQEIGDLDLLRALNHGLVPDHYLSSSPFKSMRSYYESYLKEEVLAESLVRNMPAFTRFFDAIAFSHGELVNYTNIARDCGVDAKTVKGYYQILVDTLVGAYVHPFVLKPGRNAIQRAAKFYLFDVGLANFICSRRLHDTRGDAFGKALEHFVWMELYAHKSYSEQYYDIQFWRASSGIEVDFILNKGDVAVEVKGSSNISSKHLRGLKQFSQYHTPRRSILVCLEPEPLKMGNIDVWPWRYFLHKLWQGDVI